MRKDKEKDKTKGWSLLMELVQLRPDVGKNPRKKTEKKEK
jgi:hypothetical protein